MRGTDLTEKQIEHAREFLRVSGNLPETELFTVRTDQFIRIVAWYGELRATSGIIDVAKGMWVSLKRKTPEGQEEKEQDGNTNSTTDKKPA